MALVPGPVAADTSTNQITITLEGDQAPPPPAPAQAARHVVITAPAASAASAQRAPAQAPAPKPAQQVASAAPQPRTTTAAKAGGSKAQQVARLGVVLRDKARVFRRADSRSQVLFRCDKGYLLALVGQTSRHYAILMVDKSLGFVEKAQVELYDYSVALDPDAVGPAQRIVQIAVEYMGVPYVWGGNTRGGIDCSGFVRNVFARLGFQLPRVAREQINVGRPVRWGELAPGDRLYFCSKGTTIDHTGIYIGGGKFIHASGSAGAVVISSVTEPKFFRTLVGARRS